MLGMNPIISPVVPYCICKDDIDGHFGQSFAMQGINEQKTIAGLVYPIPNAINSRTTNIINMNQIDLKKSFILFYYLITI